MAGALAAIAASITAVRAAMANDGIRRLELGWAVGIAADSALLVVLLVEVYARDGVVATALLGAIRMVPAVLSGMLSGAILARFRGDRILLAIGLIRTASAVACALVIVMNGSAGSLFLVAAIAASAGAPVRPTQATLMPAFARSSRELIAANTAWTTGEGLGALVGPLVAGGLIAVGLPAAAALVAGLGFFGTALVVVGLRFEQVRDARGAEGGGGLRLMAGIRALRRREVPRWAMLGVYGQVVTRGLLNSLVVVAAIELLGLGDPGVGLLTAAMGFGRSSGRPSRCPSTVVAAWFGRCAPRSPTGELRWP